MVSRPCIQFLQEQPDVPCLESTCGYSYPPIVTSDFVYLRLIGDRGIQEGISGIFRLIGLRKWRIGAQF